MKFFIKNFFSKCDQIRRKLRSHLLKKSLMEIIFAVLLRRTNIYYESYVTRFSYNLLLQAPFLEKHLVNNNVTGVFKDAIDEIITSHR